MVDPPLVEGAMEVCMSGSFKDLRVWHEAMDLTLDVYRVTASFPKHEIYGLTQQVRRAVVSIASNIAEGKGHRSNKEFLHFLFHARGSLLEVRTQLLIASQLEYVSVEKCRELEGKAEAVGRALNGLITSLEKVAA
jgi:four helix bundle protein